MKKLEIILKNQNVFEFYVLDKDLLGKAADISIAVIKIIVNPKDTENLYDKLLKIVEEQYGNDEYIIKYDNLKRG